MIHYNARVLRNMRIRLAVLGHNGLGPLLPGGSRSREYDRITRSLNNDVPIQDETVADLASLLGCEPRHLHLDRWDGHIDGAPDILAQIEQLTAEIIVLPDRLRKVMEKAKNVEGKNEPYEPTV